MRLYLDTSHPEVHLATVVLSRRNLLALLAKFDIPGSARTIYTDYDTPEGWTLVVQAEDDEDHYAEREPPGPMHPETEAALEEMRCGQAEAESREVGHAVDPSEETEPAVRASSEGPPGGRREIEHGARDPDHEPGTTRQSTLWQGTYWWDRRARRHEIARMPLDYLLSVISFVERRAEEFFLDELFIDLCASLQTEPIVDLAGIERASEMASPRRFRDPIKWIRATPLLRALNQAAGRQAGMDSEVSDTDADESRQGPGADGPSDDADDSER